MLISFDFRKLDCDNIGKFAKTVADNMSWLLKNGHPKWKSVDLDYPLRGWEQYDCVSEISRQGRGGRAEAGEARPASNPVMDTIKQILGD